MKILNILLICILVISCKQKEVTDEDLSLNKNSNNSLQERDIANIKYTEYVLDQETRARVQNWNEYTQLQEQVGFVKKGDLGYFKDNKEAIKALFKGLNDNIPEAMKESSIMARIKAVETKFYKLESLVNLSTTTSTELQQGIKEFLISIANLDLQMNKIVELEHQNIVKP